MELCRLWGLKPRELTQIKNLSSLTHAITCSIVAGLFFFIVPSLQWTGRFLRVSRPLLSICTYLTIALVQAQFSVSVCWAYATLRVAIGIHTLIFYFLFQSYFYWTYILRWDVIAIFKCILSKLITPAIGRLSLEQSLVQLSFQTKKCMPPSIKFRYHKLETVSFPWVTVHILDCAKWLAALSYHYDVAVAKVIARTLKLIAFLDAFPCIPISPNGPTFPPG